MPELKQIVESLLFVSDAPVSAAKLAEAIPGAQAAAVREAASALAADYDAQGRAFGLQEVAGGYQIASRPEFVDYVTRLRKGRDEGRLSSAAMETLAIVAYRQPVSRAQIDAIRGVQSGNLLRALLDKALVRIAGREDAPGQPVLYGTTPKFLQALGLASLADLPRPEELK
ncbi:MAG: SMC-Scp complex subunit ScpB [Planctomycetes bacterium]|nr:SMC-Scp complex subunit ScpB [Planctomycetota bacterium]